MRFCRFAQNWSVLALDGSDGIIKTASHALRRVTTLVLDHGNGHNARLEDHRRHPDRHCSMGRSTTMIDPPSPSGFSPCENPKGRLRVNSSRNPRRIEFYHRRHREIKRFEKKQDRIQHLRGIAREREAHGQTAIAEAAASEADRLEMPWLASNVPIKPPAYASVSQGKGTVAKAAAMYKTAATSKLSLDLKQQTKILDVLNLKVGYAIDAQYALPDEVKAFILDQTTFCLYGVDKNQVTQIASKIRRIRPPEPYKGAGIRIVGETIKLKERKIK